MSIQVYEGSGHRPPISARSQRWEAETIDVQMMTESTYKVVMMDPTAQTLENIVKLDLENKDALIAPQLQRRGQGFDQIPPRIITFSHVEAINGETMLTVHWRIPE